MPPLGALIAGFFLVALPAILLMSIWASVTAWRLLFPNEPTPMDPVARRRQATERGAFVPVRLRDIVDDQRARQSVVAERDLPETPSLDSDLWLRRN